jgi:tetratricopeptide (TPR) repeat protein
MNNIKVLPYTLLLLLFVFANSRAQITEEARKNFTKAERHIELKEYDEALPLYLSILEENTSSANINFRIGQCYLKLLGKERNALVYLQEAVKNIDTEYKPGNYKTEGASPEAWLLLGDAYHRDEELKEASRAYYKYREYIQDDKKEEQKVIDRIIALGISQGEVRDQHKDIMLSNLGDKINSKSSEYNIVYSGDLKTLAFTRYEKRRDIIFVSYFNNGSWTDPVDITEDIGSEGDMYATALSYDGSELYVVLLTSYDADIYVSKLENGIWQYAENAGRNINSKYIESNATISADGTILYFSSDRVSSIGGFDIFYSQKENGKWSKAENLGEVVNTKANEESPFITESGKTLYFSSDRKGSIGRMDVYFSRVEGEGWSVPENLGMPYNSVDDDVAFRYYEKYNKGYIARDLPGGFGKLDLYMIQSGADRQRELADYMASLRPPEPEVAEVAEPEYEPKPELLPETEPVPEPQQIVDLPAGEIPVETVAAAAVVAEAIDEKPVNTEMGTLVTEEGEYTVQFLALILPKRQSSFNDLDVSMITRLEGNDGYTRYTFGRYKTKSEARKALQVVFKHGYGDAYIRKVSELNPLSND